MIFTSETPIANDLFASAASVAEGFHLTADKKQRIMGWNTGKTGLVLSDTSWHVLLQDVATKAFTLFVAVGFDEPKGLSLT